MKIDESIVCAMRCPVCGGRLRLGDTSLTCEAPACAKVFPVVDGIPVLLNESRSLFAISDYRSGGLSLVAEGRRAGSGFLYRVLPGITRNVCAARVLPEFVELVKARRDFRSGDATGDNRCDQGGAAGTAATTQDGGNVVAAVPGGAEKSEAKRGAAELAATARVARLGQPLLHKTDVVAAVPGGAAKSEAKRGAAELADTASAARLGQPLLHKTSVVAAVPGGAEKDAAGTAATTQSGCSGRRLGGDLRARVLVLGGAEAGEGMRPLMDDPAIQLVETDIGTGSRTTLVCDAHDIPFADGTFDGVIAQAVLEYVPDPVRCVAEMHRVLAAGGIVYAETPFMQQGHGGRYDFTRYTHLGHRRLFRGFTEIDSGIACGPGAALAWAWQYFLMSCAPGRMGRRLAFMAGRLTGFWLKYLDGWLSRNPAAYDAASGFYFMGRKAEKPMEDREIVASYRGII